ncbi:MAG: hypothetical protein JXQ72_10900 [Anaerolineae bacterium]|nr:hypothetical protein [Anaerolineae bacterium]
MTDVKAVALITSKAVVARSIACIRSLQAVGTLTDATCYALCLDTEAYNILETTLPGVVKPLSVDTDLPEVKEFSDRPIGPWAWTCKPYLLNWILSDTPAEKALYFDADMWFVSDPSFLFDELDNHDIWLVPSTLTPQATIKDWDNLAKNAQRTGYYNAGSLGVSRRAAEFLAWWSNRCAYSTDTDFYKDISGDQKYLTWVPSLFDNVRIMRHYGINIKPSVTRYAEVKRAEDGSVTINGDPLVYFHFSQNLGNLITWPEIFYPEISRYLDDVEQARIDTGQPYVDMPQRDNTSLSRPLLPRQGKQAALLKLLSSYRKPLESASQTIRSSVAQSAQRLPPNAQEWVSQTYLSRWDLKGDARLSGFGELAAALPAPNQCGPVMFVGVSRLAFYLTYRGYAVDVYDPFQGHYNADLNTMFNPQWHRAIAMRDQLKIADRLALHRVPYNEISGDPAVLVLATRRTPEQLADTLATLAGGPALKQIITIFDAEWPQAYRDQVKAALHPIIGDRCSSPREINNFDVYTVKQDHE